MSLSEQIKVNTHYTRSVNLERDSSSAEVLKAYIPTSRTLRTLERVSVSLDEDQAPRAWSLIGPYGSGKSSFSVFLSDLLAKPIEASTSIAQEKLESVDPRLSEVFDKHLAGSSGMLKVLVTGSPEPMARRLLVGFEQAVTKVWAGKRGKRPAIFAQLSALLSDDEISVSETLEFIGALQLTLQKEGYKGVVLIIDELGKFLEYEARHYGANDIYLLQALAEHACKGHPCNLFLFVMLHQSFEQYAKGLGESLKNEWSKVQGRFEEVPFIESPEQVLRVVGSAFQHDFSKPDKKLIREYLNFSVPTLIEQGALPSGLKKREAINLFESCYPLHPISALILPVLCQKVAQNERTLFSYLGSHEEFGLADMISRLESVNDWVKPHHIFDYFISNQSAALSDYATHRRWAEVVTALERMGDASDSDVALLKTIGLLNIIGAKGGLKASKSILSLCMSSRGLLDTGLKNLQTSSVITYRRFSGEYRVWQGSDFDLEESLQEGLNHLGEFELAEVLNEQYSLQPIVARRYTIRNGALRYFTPLFVDAKSYKSTAEKSDQPRLILFLAAAQDDEKIFFDKVVKHFSELDVLAICKNGSQLREATAEVVALRYVGETKQELSNDPVAKREFEDRLTAAESAQENVLSDILEAPHESHWYHKAIRLEVANKREFQESLSNVLSKVYEKAPEVHNELVNRDKPTPQANAARIKLLHAMLSSSEKADLGIEKFPPEKAIYRSVVAATGLHKELSLNEWAFADPEKGTAFYYVWQRIEKFLESTEESPRSFAELNAELMAPPYGVKAGLLPILYVAVYCTKQQELAIYENRQYRPVFTADMLDRFVKRPDDFTFQRFRIVGLRASIYEEYKKLFTDGKEKTVVQLVRPLANLINGLEEYTLKTKSNVISNKAKKVRDAFKLSQSPEKLLFEDLPKVLGYSEEIEDKEGSLEGFSAELTERLKELRYAYSNMRKQFQKLLSQAFNMSDTLSLLELRQEVIKRYEGLEQYTVDVDGLRAFIKRITKRSGNDEEWLDNILMYLGQKPATKWLDSDCAEVEIKLSDYGQRVLDLETLSIEYDRSAKRNSDGFEVILLKTLKKGEEPNDRVVTIDQKQKEEIAAYKSQILSVLNQCEEDEKKLAILAELVDDFLVENKDSSLEVKKSKSEMKAKRSKSSHVH
ncbi:hypothetical protein H2508_13785 [Parahaliea sp. F7430]|uniref:ATP-binding protein n=1 Tax=Sediminihaliea albiluteola TaxID=2758564 RepID=A0A7W2TYC0_9GAMM|nr:hypothetical protein [Sediminihaliea albiluteola]MBA6414181.1 hypothetical protein [Sediminihaliea albiluteola]